MSESSRITKVTKTGMTESSLAPRVPAAAMTGTHWHCDNVLTTVTADNILNSRVYLVLPLGSPYNLQNLEHVRSWITSIYCTNIL